jgi:hypothetical protein
LGRPGTGKPSLALFSYTFKPVRINTVIRVFLVPEPCNAREAALSGMASEHQSMETDCHVG